MLGRAPGAFEGGHVSRPLKMTCVAILAALVACKGDSGAAGTRGDKGETGAIGATGPQGPAGTTTTTTTTTPSIDCSNPAQARLYTAQPAVVARGTAMTDASGKATLAGAAKGATLGVGGVTFTAIDTGTPTATQFLLGADDAATAAHLAAAINGHASVSLVAKATAAGAVVTLAAQNHGVAGNYVQLAGSSAITATAFSGGSGTGKGLLTVDGLQFRDLNASGQLEPYEDWRLAEICRAKDLVSRMSVAEKVGLMYEGGGVGSGSADGSVPASAQVNVTGGHVRQGLIRLGSFTAPQMAVYTNHLQELSESQPLGVPVVITSDPSHGFSQSTNASTGAVTEGYGTLLTPWPQPLGLGAANEAALTKLYGDVVRREFMGIGLRWQLGPQADLATEPRWARVQNVFGENAVEVAKHVKACIQGFQGSDAGNLKNGIAATMKHFPGAGPDNDGMDSHSAPGRYNVFPGNMFKYHQVPFKAAIEAGSAAVMPCYSIFKDQLDYDPLQVGSAFSKEMITDYLKKELGFDGLVTSDWGTMSSSIWGVEALTQPERAALFLKAGSHQLGSDSYTIVQAAFDQGLVTEAGEIDPAATKILEVSFKLGIFENPYVDPAAPGVRTKQNLLDGFVAQKKAIVILRNADHAGSTRYLPISGAAAQDVNGDGKVSVYFDGVQKGLVAADATKADPLTDAPVSLGAYDYTQTGVAGKLDVASEPDITKADLAVLRITSRKGTYFGLDAGVPLSFDAPVTGLQADGGLSAAIKDRNKVIDALRVRDGYTKSDGTVVAAANPKLKIVLVMHMDRPGIVKPFINGLTTLDETAGVPGSYPLVSDPANVRASTTGGTGVDGFLVEFGAFDRAVLDVLFNKNVPTSPAGYVYGTARLPMEIPSTDAEVSAQYEDVPEDTVNPTFRLGAGATF
jgi:beta-glucosidase